MKLSESTIAILKNFASINPSIQFRAGNVIKNRLPSKDLAATAVIDTEFPEDFAILDLPRFLAAVALFKDPQLSFEGDSAVKIHDGKNSVRYSFTAPELVQNNVIFDYSKEHKFPPTIAKFNLKWEEIAKVKQAASVLQVPNITVVSTDGELKLVAQDSNMPSSDRFSLTIGECDKNFVADFKIETLKMIPDDYEVVITERIATQFIGSKISYIVVSNISY